MLKNRPLSFPFRGESFRIEKKETSTVTGKRLMHHRTLIDDQANVLDASGLNLWTEIQCARKRFLIDTNFSWRWYLSDSDFSDCAFILGATIQNEMDRSTAVLCDGAGRLIVAHNFFLFSNDDGLNRWAIDRMDKDLRYIYDQGGLKLNPKFDPPIRLKPIHSHPTEIRQKMVELTI
ncbi:MAG: hypothetical protein HY735_10800 [Verrucomicrobia bacterium]|nr:hypothetical protein [Verrucomicrobiota bacterium]